MLHALLALIFSFKFLQWLGCGRPAAFMGAVVWALNGHNIFNISLEFAMIVAAWLPLALWAAGRAVKERSWRLAVLSDSQPDLVWFSGYANYSYAFGLVTATWWILLIASEFRSDRTREPHQKLWAPAALVCLAAATAVIVGAAFWLPFIDVLPTAVRVPATIDDQLKEAISPLQFIRGMIWPKA